MTTEGSNAFLGDLGEIFRDFQQVRHTALLNGVLPGGVHTRDDDHFGHARQDPIDAMVSCRMWKPKNDSCRCGRSL